MTRIDELRERLGQIEDVRADAGLLEWDQMVMMPPRGAGLRARQSATLGRIAHGLLVADDVGALLDELRPLEESSDPFDDDACLVRVTRRDRARALRVPSELLEEIAGHASASADAWAQAREDDDFAAFLPFLERTIELKRRYAACFEVDEPYDALLFDFEPGLRTSEVRDVFDVLRPALQEIARAADPGEEPAFSAGPFPSTPQEALSREIAAVFGLTAGTYRLDPSPHPFCAALGADDIRVTTRYVEGDLYATGLFATMHEVGHALYEQGIDPALQRTPLGSGCSAALHESQSRLWENVIGRSEPFWRWFYPRVQAAFPEVLGEVERETFLGAVNRVRPSFIRVDADEATYGLHLILRFELEQQLLFGDLAARDLPEAWNAQFEELVGLRVPDDRRGCLQDIHWAMSAFGYFPTYLLGAVLSVQIWERLLLDLPAAPEQVGQGELGEIGSWLRDHLYRHGRKREPREMIAHVCGGPIDPEPFLRYIRARAAASS